MSNNLRDPIQQLLAFSITDFIKDFILMGLYQGLLQDSYDNWYKIYEFLLRDFSLEILLYKFPFLYEHSLERKFFRSNHYQEIPLFTYKFTVKEIPIRDFSITKEIPLQTVTLHYESISKRISTKTISKRSYDSS